MKDKIEVLDIKSEEEVQLRSLSIKCEDALVGNVRHFSDAEIHAIANKEVIPPEGSKDRYRSKFIYFNGELVGFLAYYQGFPFPQTIWISAFYLIPEARRKGIGSKVMGALKKNEIDLGYIQFGTILYKYDLMAQRFFEKNQFYLDKRTQDEEMRGYFCTYQFKDEEK